MNTKTKAIKIDVAKREVYEIEIEPGLDAMYEAIGCRAVDMVRITQLDDLWIDDCGLLREPQPDKFKFLGHAQPLAGNGLICGYDDQGETVSTALTVEFVQQMVRWVGSEHIEPQCGFIPFDDLADFAPCLISDPAPLVDFIASVFRESFSSPLIDEAQSN